MTAMLTRPEWVRIPGPGDREFYTGLHSRKVSRLVANGDIETKRVGRTRLVRLQSLLDWVEGLEEGK